jgi:hypothetical protein
MKYRNFGSAGQVAEDEIFFLPKVLWPKKAIETEFVSVSTKGFMTAKTGRVWDYATVPFTKWLSNKIAGKKSKTPSLGHDLLCELHNLGLMPMDPTRIHTDTFFYTLLLERKFWKIRAKSWFRMVRLGAKFHKHTIKEVIEVP